MERRPSWLRFHRGVPYDQFDHADEDAPEQTKILIVEKKGC